MEEESGESVADLRIVTSLKQTSTLVYTHTHTYTHVHESTHTHTPHTHTHTHHTHPVQFLVLLSWRPHSHNEAHLIVSHFISWVGISASEFKNHKKLCVNKELTEIIGRTTAFAYT